MRLKYKLMALPLLGLLMLMVAGAAAQFATRQQTVAVTQFQRSVERMFQLERARADTLALNAEVYRLISVIGSIDERRTDAERARIIQTLKTIDSAIGRVVGAGAAPGGDGDDSARFASQARDRLRSIGRKLADALDLAQGDPNTAAAAMQALDEEFGAFSRAITEARLAETTRSEAAIASSRVLRERIEAGLLIAFGAFVLAAIVAATRLAKGLTTPLNRVIDRAQGISRGDLRTPVAVGSPGEIGQLEGAVGRMQAVLSDLVGQIRSASSELATATEQIAQGNADLSGRTELAASNLEEATSNIDNMRRTVAASTESAHQAAQLAKSASEVAERGGEVVGEVVRTMARIRESSSTISEIIGVIDGIAFQTNILALNAAVEAARAGEQGRGFAVVAGEVRQLAQRSSEAAHKITELITSSSAEIEGGSKLVRDAGATMREVLGAVRRVTDMIGEISAAAAEHNAQISEIYSAVAHLDEMTQQNAALVEESAAAADRMKEQSRELVGKVDEFLESGRKVTPGEAAEPPGPDRPGRPVRAKANPAMAPRGAGAGAKATRMAPGDVGQARASAAAMDASPAAGPRVRAQPAPANAVTPADDDWESF